MKSQTLTTKEQWKKYHTWGQKTWVCIHSFARSFHPAVSQLPYLWCKGFQKKTSLSPGQTEYIHELMLIDLLSHRFVLSVKCHSRTPTSCYGTSEQPRPSRGGLLEVWKVNPGCTCNGSRSRATLWRPASMLSLFIRLFHYFNRLWGWEQLDVIKFHPPISVSCEWDIRTKRLMKWSTNPGAHVRGVVRSLGAEATGSAKDPWLQKTCSLITWISSLASIRLKWGDLQNTHCLDHTS